MPLFGSLWLCHSSWSCSSKSFVYDSLTPFSTIHLPYSVCFLIPIYITDISLFHLHQKPYASFLDLVLYLASFTISPFRLSFRLRPPPVYKPLRRHLCLSSLTWSLILSLVQCSTIPLCVPLCKKPLKPFLLCSKGPLCPLAAFLCLILSLYSFVVSILGLWLSRFE